MLLSTITILNWLSTERSLPTSAMRATSYLALPLEFALKESGKGQCLTVVSCCLILQIRAYHQSDFSKKTLRLCAYFTNCTRKSGTASLNDQFGGKLRSVVFKMFRLLALNFTKLCSFLSRQRSVRQADESVKHRQGR